MAELQTRTDISLRRMLRVLMPDGTVEVMDIEEYLRGVVPHEIGAGSPPEALKAQAVAARCYALTSRRHLDMGADICTTTHCQVWKSETDPRSDAAIADTNGVVALHNDRVINAFFFAHCTGQTKNIEDVWETPAVAYLRGVRCPVTFPDLTGHGVGMCQEGAIALGKQGEPYTDILTHYYTNTEVVRGVFGEEMSEEQPQPAPVGRYTVHIERRPGVRRLLGTFPHAGTHFTVRDDVGNSATLYSGIDPSLGPGGWSLAAWRDGTFTLEVEGQQVPVTVRGDQVLVTFSESGEAPADVNSETSRIVSKVMSQQDADTLLADLSWYDAFEGVFTVEPAPTRGWILRNTERFASRRGIAGSLGEHGIPVVIADSDGNSVTTASGTDSAYGPGGFSAPVWRDGTFAVSIGDRTFQVEVNGDLVVLTFEIHEGGTSDMVRLVSGSMPASVAGEILAGLGGRFPGIFTIEQGSS